MTSGQRALRVSLLLFAGAAQAQEARPGPRPSQPLPPGVQIEIVTPATPVPVPSAGDSSECARWLREAKALVASDYRGALAASVKAADAADFTSEDLPLTIENLHPKPDAQKLMKPTPAMRDVKLHEQHAAALVEALSASLRRCPDGKVSWAGATFLREVLTDVYSGIRAERTGWPIVQQIIERQPHVLYYHRTDWGGIVMELDMAGHTAEAAALARAVVLSPKPGPPPALQSHHYQAALESLEDRRGYVLSFVVKDVPAAVVAEAAQVLKARPDDVMLATGGLAMLASSGALTSDHLKVHEEWPDARKLAVAQAVAELSKFQPPVMRTLAPWFAAGARYLLSDTPHTSRPWVDCPLDRKWIGPAKGAGLADTLAPVVTSMAEGVSSEPPTYLPTERWEDRADLVLAFSPEATQDRFIDLLWKKAQRDFANNSGDAEDYPDLFAKLSFLTAGPRAKLLAARGAETLLWDCQRMTGKDAPNQWSIRSVVLALLQTKQLDKVDLLMPVLDARVKAAGYRELVTFVFELKALTDILSPEEKLLPGAAVWARSESEGKEATLEWEMLISLEERIGQDKELRDAYGLDRGWRGERKSDHPNPMLESVSGRYDVEILAGPDADSLAKVAQVTSAPWRGNVRVTDLPPCGFIQAQVRSRKTKASLSGPVRAYSLLAPVWSSGPEPLAAVTGTSVGLPVTTRSDVSETLAAKHVGRLPSGRPVSDFFPIIAEAEYLLTAWPGWERDLIDIPVQHPKIRHLRMVFLDEDKKEVLGEMDLSGSAMHSTSYPWQFPRMTDIRFVPAREFVGCGMGSPPDPRRIRWAVVMGLGADSLATPLLQLRLLKLPDSARLPR